MGKSDFLNCEDCGEEYCVCFDDVFYESDIGELDDSEENKERYPLAIDQGMDDTPGTDIHPSDTEDSGNSSDEDNEDNDGYFK